MDSYISNMGVTLGSLPSGEFVTLAENERRRHVYIVGQTGTGKSTLLLNLLRQDFDNGAGVALLDPHGDLAQAALKQIPRRRANDLVYINPADVDRPIGFNPLSGVPPESAPVVAQNIVAAFQHVWPDSWGPRMHYIFLNAMRVLLDTPGATLLMLPRLLIDESFRTKLVKNFVTDPVVRGYWFNEYAGFTENYRREIISPIQNKIGQALMTPSLRNMLAQPRSTITPRRLMDEGAIVVCNLSKGALGEDASHLLGALLVTSFSQAAMSRVDTPERSRRVFHLYADEFQSFATASFSLVLSEARKYGLMLLLAHQFVTQLPIELRAAIFGNVGSTIAFRTGPDDAPLLIKQIGLGGDPALLDIENFTAWGKVLRRGVPSSPLRLNLFDSPPPVRAAAQKLIRLSRMRFGADRHEVEEKVRRFLEA